MAHGRKRLANNYDAIVIGGGHNGLVAGAYLARSGAKVVVLEALARCGGAAATMPWPRSQLKVTKVLVRHELSEPDHRRTRLSSRSSLPDGAILQACRRTSISSTPLAQAFERCALFSQRRGAMTKWMLAPWPSEVLGPMLRSPRARSKRPATCWISPDGLELRKSTSGASWRDAPIHDERQRLLETVRVASVKVPWRQRHHRDVGGTRRDGTPKSCPPSSATRGRPSGRLGFRRGRDGAVSDAIRRSAEAFGCESNPARVDA